MSSGERLLSSRLSFGLPLGVSAEVARRAGEIVFSRPCLAKHNIYPIRLPLTNFTPVSRPKNNHALGGNDHRPEKPARLIQQLANDRR